MERFSSTLLRDYLGLIRDGDRRRPGDGLFRADINADRSPPRCSSARSTRWRPTGSSAAAATRSRPKPTRSSTSSSTARGAPMTTPTTPIRSVAVLGAGTMGAQIAAHFANAGVPVAAARRHRRRRARGPEARARAQAGSVLHRRRRRARSRPAASTPTSPTLADADWIIEAVVEQLDVKRALLERVDARRGARARSSARTRRAFRSPRSPKAAATTSAGTGSARTSSTRRATCGCSSSSRPPTPIRRSSSASSQFADHRLGKGVVVAKDTPNFIANHIGALRRGADAARARVAASYTIEEIDAITGPALGRPKSATFRTMDIAGLDILGARRARTCERSSCRAFVDRASIERGLDRREGRPGLLQAGKTPTAPRS